MAVETDTGGDTHYRNCHLCEAVCGLEITTAEGRVISVRGDKDHPLSRGYICPKAAAVKDIHEDPDRLRRPVKRVGSEWHPLDWKEALDFAADGLFEVQRRFGDDAVADYIGNPYGNVYGVLTHISYLRNALNSRNSASLASVDHISCLMACSMMYGHQFLLPVPDLDQTEYFLMLGANPLASNGSAMTAPGVRGRLKALKNRGGKLVVIDPRRTETGKIADEHHFIRPGTDAAFAAAFLNTLFEEGLTNTRDLSGFVDGLDKVAEAVRPFTPERAASATGIDAGTIRRLAREFAAQESAVCYGRIGTCAQEHGAVGQWLFHLINIATGNLDRTGGFMLNTPAVDIAADPNSDPGIYDAWRTRVRGLPSFGGEFPAATMAEEMLTEGGGRIRAFVCVGANPVLSFPNGRHLDEALAGLDFMVSLDPFINETSRHANIILPPVSALEQDSYELLFYTLAVRNIGRYVEPLFSAQDNGLLDWEILVALGKRLLGRKGLPEAPTISPAEMIDIALQAGHYGKAAGHPMELSLDKLKAEPHGIDLGPLRSRMPECLQTEDKRIHCAPRELVADLDRAARELFQPRPTDDLVLIGRRHIRSKNSTMHNYRRLIKGGDRCVLFMHPDDLALRQLSHGQSVRVRSRTGDVAVPVAATDDIMPGVVSLPHGYGHGREGVRLTVASQHPGVSVNDLTDDQRVDPLTGMAAFNGVPVTVERADDTMSQQPSAGA
jgi:anaerobic selenocysteine-containing dehydrogenase